MLMERGERVLDEDFNIVREACAGGNLGVLPIGLDHTTCPRSAPGPSNHRGSRAEGAPDLLGANRRYSRVRTPAGNTVSEMRPGSSDPWGRRKDMNQTEKKVLLFPTPPKEPAASTIICQIGNERLAIHWEIEDLPPAAPLLRLQPPARKEKIKRLRVGPFRSGSSKEPHP